LSGDLEAEEECQLSVVLHPAQSVLASVTVTGRCLLSLCPIAPKHRVMYRRPRMRRPRIEDAHVMVCGAHARHQACDDKRCAAPVDVHGLESVVESRRAPCPQYRRRLQCGHSANKRVTPSTMILKCQLSPQVRRLGIRTRLKRVVNAVWAHLGEDFVQNERSTIAHPIRNNSFLRE
jgi:hypothetical protein